MNAAEITALVTALAALLGAVPAIIIAVKNNGKVNEHLDNLDAHNSSNSGGT